MILEILQGFSNLLGRGSREEVSSRWGLRLVFFKADLTTGSVTFLLLKCSLMVSVVCPGCASSSTSSTVACRLIPDPFSNFGISGECSVAEKEGLTPVSPHDPSGLAFESRERLTDSGDVDAPLQKLTTRIARHIDRLSWSVNVVGCSRSTRASIIKNR